MKLIVSVAVYASIAAAALGSYSAAMQRAHSAKASRLVTQIEGLKVALRAEIDFGERPLPGSQADLAVQLLPLIIMKGVPLTGVPSTDAAGLGFSSLSVGTLDTENLDGSVALPGIPASVTLRDGTLVGKASR